MHWVVEFVGCLSTKRTRNPMRLGNLDVFPCNEVVTCTEACVSSPEKCIVVQLRKCEDDHERVCFGPDTFISLTPSVLTHLELLLSSSAEDISVVHVPDAVREIPSECFYGCRSIRCVRFSSSSSLERICERAFSKTSLTEISIPDGVLELCSMCFWSISSFRRITFGAASSLLCISHCVFTSLHEISIPDSVRELCDRCFRYCYDITTITFGASSELERIGNEAFSDTRIREIHIPDSVREIGNKCFYVCIQLRRVIFGVSSSLQRIGDGAFYITALRHISIPASVRELGENCFFPSRGNPVMLAFDASTSLERIGCMCFSGCHLTFFRVPPSIRYIHPKAFRECILTDGLVCSCGCFNDLHGCLMVDQSGSICSCWIDLVHEIFVPDSVRELGDKCFFGYHLLTRVNFGSSSRLERIGVCSLSRTSICELNIPDRVEYLCDKCFCACKKLTRINFCASSMAKSFGRTLLSVGPELSCLVHEIIIPDSVLELCDECFFGCNGLKRVTFGKSSALEYIGFQCFVLSTLESFRMPSSVKLFGGGAFNSCPLRGLTCSNDCLFCERNCLLLDRANEICYSGIGFLNSVCVPDSVRELCDGCFYGCCHLEYVTFSVSSSLEHIGSQCFALSGLRSFRMPASVNTIGSEVFRGCLLQEGIICDENCGFCLEHGLLLDKSCTICYGAIKGRYIVPKAMEIYVPNGVRELCDRCFYGCTFLEIVSFGVPCSLERIGCECFKRCRLISFEMPSSVTSVGSGAFNECHIKNGLICSAQCHFCVKNNLLLDKSGTICYSGVGFFRVVNVPDSVRELCDRCFYGCEHLERVNFGIRSSIERIGSQCFVDCCLQYIYFGMPPSCMYANHTSDKCPGFDRSLFRRIANPASTSLYERATEDKVQENQSAGCLLP